MEFETGYIMALIVIGISFLGFSLALMIDEINKRKGIIIFILSLILFGLGAYYYYLTGQHQKDKGGYSPNKLNHYLYIYRQTPPSSKIPF